MVNSTYLLMGPILIPIIAGIVLLCLPEFQNRKWLLAYVGITVVGSVGILLPFLIGSEYAWTVCYLLEDIPVLFHLDGMGKIFASMLTVVFVASTLHSSEYMKHEEKNKRYYGFCFIVYGVLLGVACAGNLVTFYLCYELMTLMSLPLVIHNLSKEAIMAGLKYLFYSFCGAYMALFGIYFLYQYTDSLSFLAGGTLDLSKVMGHEGLLLGVIFITILGFGVKAGMFPMHGWLTTAHPVAPAPASALLSAIIVKSGVLALIRVVYFIVGPEFLRGTWVQMLWLGLTLITVFMGSMLAFREPVMKKRLAYSTISQVSYILFGLALLNPTSFTGSVLHMVFHAIIKSGLFLFAGMLIYDTGKVRMDEFRGIGKRMPIAVWAYLFLSLALVGIPPASGFISKWYLAVGALEGGIAIFSWLGPVVLLISALLTAGYLLPLAFGGFFPGEDFDYKSLVKKEPAKVMLIPVVMLAGLAMLLGMFPNALVAFITRIAVDLF